jgi:acetylornithine deacetylase/succinyl-diaminopimelate desuccinylase-like protein
MTGLGASDDKWGVACMLNIIRLVAGHPALKRKRIRFCSTIDEESGVGNGLLLLMLAGVTADAAIYLDGGMNRVCIGNCGGSNFYLRPRDEQARQSLDDDTAALVAMAARMSRERRPMFDRLPYFNDNSIRDQSVIHALRTDTGGRHHMVSFYTLPGESREDFCRSLEAAVASALGARLARYETSYREPWFEPSCAAPDDAWTTLMADAVGRAIGAPAVVSTITKQDAFVLRNHANMPIISYGVRAHAASRMNHQPNETIALDEVWTGLVAGHEMVKAWLERD